VCLKKTLIPYNIIKTVNFNLIIKLARWPAEGQIWQLAKSLARARRLAQQLAAGQTRQLTESITHIKLIF
jgi:hypothetical protein